eukprot:1492471-Prymnesium_polylepis.1
MNTSRGKPSSATPRSAPPLVSCSPSRSILKRVTHEAPGTQLLPLLDHQITERHSQDIIAEEGHLGNCDREGSSMRTSREAVAACTRIPSRGAATRQEVNVRALGRVRGTRSSARATSPQASVCEEHHSARVHGEG